MTVPQPQIDPVGVDAPTSTQDSEGPSRSPGRRARVVKRVLRSPLGLASFLTIVTLVILAGAAPLIAPYDPNQAAFGDTLALPGAPGHLLGTDELGRDILSRVLFGLRSSLLVGLLTVLFAVGFGVPLGLLAGYVRWMDPVISRLADVALAFPFLIVAVGLAAIRGGGLMNAAIALSISQIPSVLRVVRSETLRLKSADFVSAAVVDGANSTWILAKHILPNAMSSILVQATVAFPVAILGEAVLSFLGLGIQPPDPSLGTMLTSAQSFATRAPYLAAIPGLFIALLALAFNVFGDALRDALDPRGSRS